MQRLGDAPFAVLMPLLAQPRAGRRAAHGPRALADSRSCACAQLLVGGAHCVLGRRPAHRRRPCGRFPPRRSRFISFERRLSASCCGRAASSAMAARVSCARAGECFDLFAGALAALAPLVAVRRRSPASVRPGPGLALDPVMPGARLGIGGAVALDRVAQAPRVRRASPSSGGQCRNLGLRQLPSCCALPPALCAMRRLASSRRSSGPGASAVWRSWLASARRATSTAEVAARQASRRSRSGASAASSACRAASNFCRAASAAAAASRISISSEARRLRSASRLAAALGASAAAVNPSQRHRSPSRDTSRWPGRSCGLQRLAQRPRYYTNV